MVREIKRMVGGKTELDQAAAAAQIEENAEKIEKLLGRVKGIEFDFARGSAETELVSIDVCGKKVCVDTVVAWHIGDLTYEVSSLKKRVEILKEESAKYRELCEQMAGVKK